MNKLILLIVVVVSIALLLFKHHSNENDAPVSFYDTTTNHKCIDQNGSIYYGEVPEGVVCEKNELIDGALTIFEGGGKTNETRDKGKSKNRCDGRVYCSQMSSCAEATYYLKNCPNTKMDGDNNGVPCEKQWCS